MAYGDHAGDSEDLIVSILVEVQRRLGLTGQDSAFETIDREMRLRYSGENYVRKTPPFRNSLVRLEFNGTNRDEVCRKHGISTTQFYEIIKQR